MKTTKLLLSMAIVALTFSVNATVITVSNNPDSPGQYTSLQAAIDAANPTDTIYVAGSQISYGNVTLGKQIVLIGAGYRPNNQYGFKTQLGSISLNSSNASGTIITGLYIGNTITATVNDVNNISIYRNYIDGINAYRSLNNWTIKNNIIRSYIQGSTSGTNTITNVYIENNIFYYGSISSFNSNSLYISNNIFTHTSSGFNVFSVISYAIIANNIFYGTSTQGCDFCTFNNNLSSGGTNLTFNYASNNASGNIEDLNPQFTDVSGYAFDYTYDYHLKATSPGYQAGLDGKDLGIYGGNYPFPSGGDQPWQTSAMPAIPQVDTVNITNAVVPAGGTLSVEIKGRSNQ
jgi:hypothetical protein